MRSSTKYFFSNYRKLVGLCYWREEVGSSTQTNSQGAHHPEAPALGSPTFLGARQPRSLLPGAPTCAGNRKSWSSSSYPKTGEIFPHIIPSTPDEKPKCQQISQEHWETEEGRERGRGSETERAPESNEGELTTEGIA